MPVRWFSLSSRRRIKALTRPVGGDSTPEHVTAARLVICEHAPADAALFLDMLGIGSTPAWNMQVQA